MLDAANEAKLSIPEGVLLCHALVARVAESLDVRVFFIKGPACVVQGLREPKTSADVDVFVAPSSLEQMVQGLRERGWRNRPVDPDSWAFQQHSVTLDHADWPCCIDVHFRFPGMENPASQCFDLMWGNTERLELAGQQLLVPSKALGILILALHALRTPHLPACRHELDFLARFTERESQLSALLDIATATGSLAAMRPFLENLVPENALPDWPPPTIEWRNRLLAKEPGSALLIAMAQTPWLYKLKMLRCAVFPRPEVLLSRDIYADMSLMGRFIQQRDRGARFLRSSPRIVRDLRSLRG